MKRIVSIIIATVLGVALIVGASIMIGSRSGDGGTGEGVTFSRAAIVETAGEIDYSKYNLDTVVTASDDTGGLAEKIEGDASTAKVIIFEYADYACPHCADINSTVNRIVANHPGEVAVVFRTLVLSFPNSVSSASAATAAANQGYWTIYKNLLFSNQAEWYYMKGEKRDTYFVDLFMTASAGKGDRAKFLEDMASAATVQRLAFNYGAAERLGIDATPAFRINGEKVAQSDLESKVEELLQ